MTPTTPDALTQAIAAVETAQTNLTNANTSEAAAQSKFDAARQAKADADKADSDAVTAFNSALDALIAAATAAKVPVPAPPPPPATAIGNK